jgi:hypothetical protein
MILKKFYEPEGVSGGEEAEVGITHIQVVNLSRRRIQRKAQNITRLSRRFRARDMYASDRDPLHHEHPPLLVAA